MYQRPSFPAEPIASGKTPLAVKKVLQSCLSSSWGGLEMVAYENAIALAQNGFECHTLCLANSPLENHLKTLALPTLSLTNAKKFFDFLKIRQFILDHDIKTVLVQVMSDLRPLSMALINHEEIKVFAISHTFVNVNKKDFWHRWSYSKINKLVCLTDLHKKNILQNLPLRDSQLEVIPNYVDCNRFHSKNYSEDVRRSLGAAPGSFLVGVTSRLDPQKGQDCAIKALTLLKRKNIPVQLAIVGENTRNEQDYLSVLRQMTCDYGVENQVCFAGFRQDMEKIMASLDVLLMPSLCETFGRVVIEAMASKTPVIATNAGGVPNIIDNGKNGLLVIPNSHEELATAIETLAHNPAYREQLVERAFFKVRTTYARDVVESKLLNLLTT